MSDVVVDLARDAVSLAERGDVDLAVLNLKQLPVLRRELKVLLRDAVAQLRQAFHRPLQALGPLLPEERRESRRADAEDLRGAQGAYVDRDRECGKHEPPFVLAERVVQEERQRAEQKRQYSAQRAADEQDRPCGLPSGEQLRRRGDQDRQQERNNRHRQGACQEKPGQAQ